MKMKIRRSHIDSSLRGALLTALLFASHPASAQTFFGSGGASNNAAANATNTGLGYGVLSTITTGINNTGIGFKSLFVNTTGSYNTANGTYALTANQYLRQNGRVSLVMTGGICLLV